MSMFVSTRQHTMVLQGVGLAWPLRYFVPWTNWLKFCWRRWELWTSPRQSLLLECEQGCRALSLRLGNKQRFFDGRWVLWCTMVCWNVWSDLFPLILIFSLPTPIMPHLPPSLLFSQERKLSWYTDICTPTGHSDHAPSRRWIGTCCVTIQEPCAVHRNVQSILRAELLKE